VNSIEDPNVLSPATLLRIPRHVVFRNIGGQTYVLPAISKGRMLRLDNVAAYIWNCLEASPTFGQVCDQLATLYPRLPAQQVRSDVTAFIQRLVPSGFITTSNHSMLTRKGPFIQTMHPVDERYLWRHAAELDVPLKANIELTQNCNLACSYCYLRRSRYEPMSTEQVKQLLSDLATLGCMFLALTGGEPFLRRDLLEIIQCAESRRFTIRILTRSASRFQIQCHKGKLYRG